MSVLYSESRLGGGIVCGGERVWRGERDVGGDDSLAAVAVAVIVAVAEGFSHRGPTRRDARRRCGGPAIHGRGETSPGRGRAERPLFLFLFLPLFTLFPPFFLFRSFLFRGGSAGCRNRQGAQSRNVWEKSFLGSDLPLPLNHGRHYAHACPRRARPPARLCRPGH